MTGLVTFWVSLAHHQLHYLEDHFLATAPSPDTEYYDVA